MARHGVQGWDAGRHGDDPSARSIVRGGRGPGTLAMDSAGRAVLCDHPMPMNSPPAVRTKQRLAAAERSAEALHREFCERNPKFAKKYFGVDAALGAPLDDDRAGKLKEFLRSRLSPADHDMVSHMLDRVGPDDENDNPPVDSQAADARSFFAAYPDAALIRNAGGGAVAEERVRARKRMGSPVTMAADRAPSASDAASFYAMYPDAKKIALK